MPAALIFLGGAAIFLFAMTARASSSFDPFSDLTRSSTADRLGIDNRIPPEFQHRAHGLRFVVNAAKRDGLSLSSIFRTRELTAAIRAGLKPGETVPALPGPGSHDTARAFDVRPIRKSGELNGSPVATSADLFDTVAAIRSVPEFDGIISKIIPEGANTFNAHAHVQFIGAELDRIATQIKKGSIA